MILWTIKNRWQIKHLPNRQHLRESLADHKLLFCVILFLHYARGRKTSVVHLDTCSKIPMSLYLVQWKKFRFSMISQRWKNHLLFLKILLLYKRYSICLFLGFWRLVYNIILVCMRLDQYHIQMNHTFVLLKFRFIRMS